MMKKLPFLIFCCLLLLCNTLQASQSIRAFSDSAEIFEKIKNNEQNYKRQKSKLLRKFKTTDSLIVYHCDKHQSSITCVVVSNGHLEYKYFWFINNKLFKINLQTLARKTNGQKQKRGKGFYFIENDAVFYKEEKGVAKDVNALIIEANKYLSEGLKLLQEQQ
jgi:hypothetical protein